MSNKFRNPSLDLSGEPIFKNELNPLVSTKKSVVPYVSNQVAPCTSSQVVPCASESRVVSSKQAASNILNNGISRLKQIDPALATLIGSAAFIILSTVVVVEKSSLKTNTFKAISPDAEFMMEPYSQLTRNIPEAQKEKIMTEVERFYKLYNSEERVPLNLPSRITVEGDFVIAGVYPQVPSYKYATIASYDRGTKNISISFSTSVDSAVQVWNPSTWKNEKKKLSNNATVEPKSASMEVSFKAYYNKSDQVSMKIDYSLWDARQGKYISVPTAHSNDSNGSMEDYDGVIAALQKISTNLEEGQKTAQASNWINY